MIDYRWKFPLAGLTLALDGLAALRADLGFAPDALPLNALGDRRDANGDVVAPVYEEDAPQPAAVAWIGRPGIPPTFYDDGAGKIVEIPAKGDPQFFYMHIRVSQGGPDFDPGAYGMEVTDPAESGEVLGIWAGDEA